MADSQTAPGRHEPTDNGRTVDGRTDVGRTDDIATTNGRVGQPGRPGGNGGAPRVITDADEFRDAMNVARRGDVSDIVDVLRRTDLTKLARTRRGVRGANGGDDVLIVRA